MVCYECSNITYDALFLAEQFSYVIKNSAKECQTSAAEGCESCWCFACSLWCRKTLPCLDQWYLPSRSLATRHQVYFGNSRRKALALLSAQSMLQVGVGRPPGRHRVIWNHQLWFTNNATDRPALTMLCYTQSNSVLCITTVWANCFQESSISQACAVRYSWCWLRGRAFVEDINFDSPILYLVWKLVAGLTAMGIWTICLRKSTKMNGHWR